MPVCGRRATADPVRIPPNLPARSPSGTGSTIPLPSTAASGVPPGVVTVTAAATCALVARTRVRGRGPGPPPAVTPRRGMRHSSTKVPPEAMRERHRGRTRKPSRSLADTGGGRTTMENTTGSSFRRSPRTAGAVVASLAGAPVRRSRYCRLCVVRRQRGVGVHRAERPSHAGGGDRGARRRGAERAEAEFCRVEGDEIAVALVSPARGEGSRRTLTARRSAGTSRSRSRPVAE